jgi:ribosome-associated protein
MDKEKIATELRFHAVRSSGSGGQNVNKVSSKVVLTFNVCNSNGLSKDEKSLVKGKLSGRINAQNEIKITCDEERSQLQNKELVVKRFFEILNRAFTIQKPRKATKIPKSAIEGRLKRKKITAELKSFRKKIC